MILRRTNTLARGGFAVVVAISAVVASRATDTRANSGDATASTASSSDSVRSKGPSGEVDVSALRLREGTRFTNVIGRFRLSGESLVFIDEVDREIGGLPNLNLDRIARMLKSVESPENIRWSVSGVITEFSERNYILISRAVYKAAAPPPAPEMLKAASAKAPTE